MRPFLSAALTIKNFDIVRPVLEEIAYEFKPNSGSSLHDKICSIEAVHGVLENKMAAIELSMDHCRSATDRQTDMFQAFFESQTKGQNDG